MLSFCTNNPCCADVVRFGILKELGQRVTHGAEIIQISFLPIQRVWKERLQGKQKSGVGGVQPAGERRGLCTTQRASGVALGRGFPLPHAQGTPPQGCPITDNESDTLAGSWLFWFYPRFRVDLLFEKNPVLKLPFTQPLGESKWKEVGFSANLCFDSFSLMAQSPWKIKKRFLLEAWVAMSPFLWKWGGRRSYVLGLDVSITTTTKQQNSSSSYSLEDRYGFPGSMLTIWHTLPHLLPVVTLCDEDTFYLPLQMSK